MRTEPELQELYLQWSRSPNNPELNRQLAQQLQPWVDHAILAAGGSPSDRALRAKANMMALGYLRQYDPEKSNIKNFLYAQLCGLHRVVRNDQNIIQVPERVALGRKALADAEKEFLDEYGRSPSTQELSDRLGTPMKQIQKWRSANRPIAESTLNALLDSPGYPASRLVDTYSADNAWQNYVYDSLQDRTKAVMERLYGMNGFQPQKPAEVAKALKISQAAVSQHRKKIDSLLNDDSRYELFGG